MSGIDEAVLNAAADWDSDPIEVLRSGPGTRELLPQSWWPIMESIDPEERRRTALALWNRDFMDLIPRYAEALTDALVDVRVARHSWLPAPSLDYVLRDWSDELVVWVGEDPRTFGDTEPPLFESVPQPVRTFQRHVHAGFTTYDGLSCGVRPPRHMETMAASWGTSGEDESYFWEEDDYDFPGPQRLLVLTSCGSSQLFTSPDLPVSTAVTYFEPDFEIKPFGEALDHFMTTMPLGR